jgi:hypothetical protein
MVEIGTRDGAKKCDEIGGPLLEMRMPVRAYVLALGKYPEGHCEVESAFLNDCANVFGEGRWGAKVGSYPNCDLTEVNKRHRK